MGAQIKSPNGPYFSQIHGQIYRYVQTMKVIQLFNFDSTQATTKRLETRQTCGSIAEVMQ
jgi:hypothetical protein